MSLERKVQRVLTDNIIQVKMEAIQEYECRLFTLPLIQKLKVCFNILRGGKK